MRNTLLCTLLLSSLSVVAQTGPDLHWVRFTDKDNTPYSLDAPEEYLSPRALTRRAAQNIALDEQDLPVDPAYIAAVLATGEVQLVNRSKWFNAITVRTSDASALETIAALPFVAALRSVTTTTTASPNTDKFRTPRALAEERGGASDVYGRSFRQIEMLNGHTLHALNAEGQGMLIGVLDSGFERVNEIDAFEDLRTREGILATRDLVDHDGDIYQDHWHGRSVLGCMTGHIPGQLRGTAPEADYVLVRTETVSYERVVEEDNWVAGAEFCDSIGCDVLNTSLGYTTFDDSLTDHVYADMDGQTTRISIAAGIASRKGMIPVQSAGNSGSSEWFHIGAPADAIDILAVGGVDSAAVLSGFSSRGPSADGRVKPDIAAMASGVAVVNGEPAGIAEVNGTSFASPIVAGLVACLWQLHPERTAQQIMDAVRRSASQFNSPDAELGYGIPDFLLAHELLVASVDVRDDVYGIEGFQAYPVPFSTSLTLRVPTGIRGPVEVRFIDAIGRTGHLSNHVPTPEGKVELNGLETLPRGSWLIRLRSSGGQWIHRVVKE